MSKWTKRRTGAGDGWYISDDDGGRVVAFVSDGYARADLISDLIASAPALVEALEACLGLLTGNMDGDLPADRDPVEMARAALSLAKGTTQGETK